MFGKNREPLKYARPSAEIRIQPDNIAHPEREPILVRILFVV